MTVHVYPLNDWIDHDINSSASECECVCEPRIDWVESETGEPLPEPIVVHNAVDGRQN